MYAINNLPSCSSNRTDISKILPYEEQTLWEVSLIKKVRPEKCILDNIKQREERFNVQQNKSFILLTTL